MKAALWLNECGLSQFAMAMGTLGILLGPFPEDFSFFL